VTLSHQVSFYATKEDVVSIEAGIRGIGPMVILHDRSLDGRPRVVDSLDYEQGGERWLYFFLVRPEHLAQVELRQVPLQDYWSIDATSAPVVEFHLPFYSEEVMRRGRAYFVDSYYAADGTLVQKSSEFSSWAKQVLAAVRKTLVKQGANYIGLGAKGMLESLKPYKLED
jgi:hypothetical protein